MNRKNNINLTFLEIKKRYTLIKIDNIENSGDHNRKKKKEE